MKITTLIENNQSDKENLFFEHGLSLLLEADGKRILFDTGQSGNFIENSILLNKNLSELDAVIISHGHYDHSGGYKKFVEVSQHKPELIVGEEFFKPKYKIISENEYKYNGNSFDEEYIYKESIQLRKISEDITYLSDKIIIFHHFTKSNEFEKMNSRFLIKENSSYIPDEFDDEIAIGVITEKGLVVIVGCSHVGVVNILDTIYERINIPIYAVIGGTHLVEADERRIQKTIDSLKKLKIQLVAVSHCTGENGIKNISEAFKGQFIFNNTGSIIEIK